MTKRKFVKRYPRAVIRNNRTATKQWHLHILQWPGEGVHAGNRHAADTDLARLRTMAHRIIGHHRDEAS